MALPLLCRTFFFFALIAALQHASGERIVGEIVDTFALGTCLDGPLSSSSSYSTNTSFQENLNWPSGYFENVAMELERERLINELIEDTDRQWRNGNGKEQKLQKMLEEWHTIYLPRGKDGLIEWYKLARREVFTAAGTERLTEEDGSEWRLNKERAFRLFECIEDWKQHHEEFGTRRDALFYFYGEVRTDVFGLVERAKVDDESEEVEVTDPWRVSSDVDSHHGTHYDLVQYFKCEDLEERAVEPYNDKMIWEFLRHHYLGVVGKEKSNIVGIEGSGFQVDVAFEHIEGKGRGVVATQFIPKNTIVVDGFQFAARFDNAVDFRRFILSLPQHIACDCLMWNYVETFDEFDPESLRIVIDLDGQGMINNGNESVEGEDDDTEYSNIYSIRGSGKYISTRDIQIGEQLECDYADFETQFYWWGYFGL